MRAENHLVQLIKRYPILAECAEDIQKAFEIIRAGYRQGGMLLICGNGGSGADCEHIVGELMKEFKKKRPLDKAFREKLQVTSKKYGALLAQQLQGALPAIALTGHMALSTAYANDALPEMVFAQQVCGYGGAGSTLLAISTSGNAKNVIYGVETAKALDMAVIGLTGESGGELKEQCELCICVPEKETFKIQELHLPVYHTLCLMLEEEFF